MTGNRTFALGLAVWLAAALPAAAYVGPGAGLSALGALVALVGSFFLLLAGFVWYPIKRMRRRRGAARNADAARPTAGPESEG